MTIRNLFVIPFLSLALYSQDNNITTQAQEKKIEYINEISFLIGNSENGFDKNIDRSLAYDLQFQYNGLDFPIRPEIEFFYSQDISLYQATSSQTNTRFGYLLVNGIYEIPYTDTLTPFVKAGAGYQTYSDVPSSPPSGLVLDAGAGLKLNLSDRWSLKFQALTTFNTDQFNILATAGVSFRFGRKYVAPPPEKVCEPCEEPKTIIVTKEPVKVFKPLHVQFAFAKATLTDESKASFVDSSKELNSPENIDKNILIIGNTDSKGTRSFNATLSIKRANAVRSAFIANGVDAERISIDGLGEMNPVADNGTEEGREKNRRVIIILSDK